MHTIFCEHFFYGLKRTSQLTNCREIAFYRVQFEKAPLALNVRVCGTNGASPVATCKPLHPVIPSITENPGTYSLSKE